jgi:hypothetical protein
VQEAEAVPRKKVEHPNVMTVETVNGTIRQPFSPGKAVIRGGDLIAGRMGMAKSTLYERMDEKNVVWVNSTPYALGKNYRGHLVTYTSSADNWEESPVIQQQLEAEREQKIREGAAAQAKVAPRKQGKFTKGD